MSSKQTKVGLLLHCGGGNLGDDGTMEAVIRNIRSRWPSADLFAFSMNPGDTEARHGIPCYAIRTRKWTLGGAPENDAQDLKSRLKTAAGRHPALFTLVRAIYALVFKVPAAAYEEIRFLTKSFHLLRSFDLMVIAGGGQLTESWGGPWTFPYTIFKWVLLARLAGVRTVVLNVGAGPLRRRLSQYFVRAALSLSEYRSFRDAQSADLIHKIGFRGETQVFPDAVYSLEIDSGFACRPENHRAARVGIAPMPYGLKPLYAEAKPDTYDRLIGGLAQFASRLITGESSVTLFCTDIGVDPLSVHDLRRALMRSDKLSDDLLEAAIPRSIKDLLRIMSTMDYVVTCRFHGVVYAHLMNIPVLALSHHQKINTLMEDLGLSRYCLDIKNVEPDALTETFSDLVANAAQIKIRMSAAHSSYKDQLARQFDGLFPHRPTV